MRVRLKAAKHAVFTRNGTDLQMEMKISLREALLGFEKSIRHLDGHPVSIRQGTISSHGQVLTLKDEGMPVHGVPSEFGKLHVRLVVVMPKRLTSDEKEFVGANFEPEKEEIGKR